MTRPVLFGLALLLAAPAAAQQTLTIATFNAEFLTRPRVHIKFGLPFATSSFSAAETAQWTNAFRNARFAEAQRSTSPAAMVEELKASQAAFLEAARELPEERFAEGRAAYRILHATGVDHYPEHAPEIRAWREREGA